ncbi:hypothetical protein [Ramlibacter sp.]|uniref:hypothetical protein n=1 Tax=Ramlibacter sp. TaxID=1917967 RepID=UPI0025D32E6B|nr:hypothetical protein [Ramlibacter sp.]
MNPIAATTPVPMLSPEALAALAGRYIEMWNIADAAERRRAVESVWVPEGCHSVRTLQARGYEELVQRVASSHEKNVRDKGFRFRLSGQPQQLQGAVLLHWDMMCPPSPALEAYGLVFAHLAPDGRIAADYQFVLPTPQA